MNQLKHHNQWIALQVRLRNESHACSYLVRNGYEALLPRHRRCKHCPSGCNGEVLFPGYLFCRFDAHNQCRMMTAPGFIRFVGFGNNVPTLEQHEIHNLRIAGACNHCLRCAPLLKEGASVKIVGGPLSGVRGLYVRSGKKGNLVLSVSLLGRSVYVELSDADMLHLASESGSSTADC